MPYFLVFRELKIFILIFTSHYFKACYNIALASARSDWLIFFMKKKLMVHDDVIIGESFSLFFPVKVKFSFY